MGDFLPSLVKLYSYNDNI
jgi:hypothetical protein